MSTVIFFVSTVIISKMPGKRKKKAKALKHHESPEKNHMYYWTIKRKLLSHF